MKAVWGLQSNPSSTNNTKGLDGGLFQDQSRTAFPQRYRRYSNVLLEDCKYDVVIPVPTNRNRTSVELGGRTSDLVHGESVIEEEVTAPQEKIVINVRGRLYETFTETLGRFPNTLLGCSETRQVFYEMDKQQYCFGLRDVSCFDSILFYYQSNGILARPADVHWQTFYNEIRFFQLDENAIQHFLESEGLKIQLNEETETLPEERVWKLLEYPNSSNLAQAFAMISVLIIFLSIIIFCGETLPSVRKNSQKKSVFNFLEIFCIAWFTLEYIVRLAFSPNRKQFCLSAIGCIDLLAIVPALVTSIMSKFNYGTNYEGLSYVVRVLKLLRVLRVLKFSRYVHGMYLLGQTLVMSFEYLVLLLLCLLISSVLFASVAYFVDSCEDRTSICSILDELWFAIITLTTVGYGDIVPVSTLGKLNASFCMFVGVVVLSIPVPVIVKNFVTLYRLPKER